MAQNYTVQERPTSSNPLAMKLLCDIIAEDGTVQSVCDKATQTEPDEPAISTANHETIPTVVWVTGVPSHWSEANLLSVIDHLNLPRPEALRFDYNDRIARGQGVWDTKGADLKFDSGEDATAVIEGLRCNGKCQCCGNQLLARNAKRMTAAEEEALGIEKWIADLYVPSKQRVSDKWWKVPEQ